MKKILALLLALGISSAIAQTAPSITFGANVTTGNGSVTPVLTWSTTPTAQTCVASGDWTGSKAVSGTQTLESITKSATYNLACTWPGDNTITLTWTPPTANTDGSTLTDLDGYKVYYGTSASMSANQIKEVAAGLNTVTLGPLAAGTWYMVMSAINQADVESVKAPVPPVSKTLTASASVSKTVGIVVNPVPMAPTNITVQ
jgi:hypothetical protein